MTPAQRWQEELIQRERAEWAELKRLAEAGDALAWHKTFLAYVEASIERQGVCSERRRTIVAATKATIRALES